MSKANVIFTFEGIDLIIQSTTEDKMKDICEKYSIKINKAMNSILFLYEGNQVNFELSFKEHANSIDRKNNKMKILVYKRENNEHNNINKINNMITITNNIAKNSYPENDYCSKNKNFINKIN